MTTFLLDVNLLLALFDPNHVSHATAHHWYERTGRKAWATCPITENGFVRIASHPSYPSWQGTATEATEALASFCASGGHHFWPDDLSLRDHSRFHLAQGGGPTHLTDLYLLGLAVRHGGRLATFDRRIPVRAVAGGADALELVTA